MYVTKLFVLSALLVVCLNNAQAQDVGHHVVPLKTMKPGQWVEKVWGDPTRSGEPFVIRIHQDAGYITLPHVHPIDESITVVKGSWSLGMGRRFDSAALEPMEAGAFGMAPKNMAHFALSNTETILQVHGIGPFTSTVTEPVYELTDKGVFSLTSLLLPGHAISSSPPTCFALKINAKVSGALGAGRVVGARCSPTNRITEYWVQKSNGQRFWATVQQLRQL
jgi:hypothetical protein